ncbi:MAG: hypothetical protein NTY01_10405 [Verrucomicrobia bacterium]|nr:hypothetical protein [Verrucomicrobiota bacterium]
MKTFHGVWRRRLATGCVGDGLTLFAAGVARADGERAGREGRGPEGRPGEAGALPAPTQRAESL